MLDGSKDADSHRDVPFWGFVYTGVYLMGQIPPITQFEGTTRHFQANVRKIQTFIFSKLLHRLQSHFGWSKYAPKQVQDGRQPHL